MDRFRVRIEIERDGTTTRADIKSMVGDEESSIHCQLGYAIFSAYDTFRTSSTEEDLKEFIDSIEDAINDRINEKDILDADYKKYLLEQNPCPAQSQKT